MTALPGSGGGSSASTPINQVFLSSLLTALLGVKFPWETVLA